MLVSFGFCSFRETPRSGVADAICSGLLARSYSEPSRRMYCSPPTVLSLLRSRLSTTWVSVGSTTPLSSRPAWLLLLSGCGVGVGVGSTWGGVVASSLPPQAAVPRAMRTAIVKLFSFIVSFHSIRGIPDCYGFRFERLRAVQRFVLTVLYWVTTAEFTLDFVLPCFGCRRRQSQATLSLKKCAFGFQRVLT